MSDTNPWPQTSQAVDRLAAASIDRVATSQAVIQLPTLPTWTDPQSVASYIIAVFGLLASALTIFHVGLPAGTSNLVQVWAPVAGLAVAGAIQAVNIITHRAAHAKVQAALLTMKVVNVNS